MRGWITIGLTTWAISFASVPVAVNAAGASRGWIPRDGDVLVVVGDEIAQPAGDLQFLENYILTRYPGRNIRVVNACQPDSCVSDILQHFAADVAVHRPTHVAVLLGVQNDGVETIRDDRIEAFRRDIADLDRRIRALNAVPIYCSPIVLEKGSARESRPSLVGQAPHVDTPLAEFGAWLHEFASQTGADFVDWNGSLARLARHARLDGPDVTTVPDGLALDSIGSLAMAAAFLDELGLARPLSSIQITIDRTMACAVAEGGLVLNLQATLPQTISFLWQADALPWSVASESAFLHERMRLGERFNRETLQVEGLPDGTYVLQIDGQLIGYFSDEQFEKGIDLHDLPTPQAEQARRIAQENCERTEASVRPANRDLALARTLARLRRASVKRPDDVRLEREIARLEESLAGVNDRLARRRRDSDARWNCLQEQAQPALRQFVIRPVMAARVYGRVLRGDLPVSGALIELHSRRGLTAIGTTDAMGYYQLTAQLPGGIPPGDAWLVVLAKMVLPTFISLEQSGHPVSLRSGSNEIELHFEETPVGE